MDEQLLERIRGCDTLPTLPAVAVQVLELVRNPACKIPQLARVISKDPALASKILRTVNSAIYARPKKISRLTQALTLLGFQTVRVLVLGFSLVHNLKAYRNKGFRPLDYWRRAIYSATAALTLAQRVRLELQEEAFVAALLMDMGMLALAELFGEQYGQIHDRARTHGDVLRLEESLLNTNHARVSGALAEMWGIPETLSVPMAHHHSAAAVQDPALRRLAEVCYLAGRCADVFVEESAAGAIAELREYCQANYAMSDADCDALLNQIARRTGEIAPLFDLHLNTDVSYEEILKKANESIVEITLESQARARLGIEGPAETGPGDPVSGLAERTDFDAFLARRFTDGSPLSVVIAAVDELHDVAGRHGAAAADAVLRAVAQAARAVATPADLATRFGDDRVGLVLRADRAEALARAEGVRRRVAESPVDSGRLTLPVTVTIGLAAVEPGSPFKAPAHVVRAAELALEAGRVAGRNCVRAFAPPLRANSPTAA